jgi:hypothetical protein
MMTEQLTDAQRLSEIRITLGKFKPSTDDVRFLLAQLDTANEAITYRDKTIADMLHESVAEGSIAWRETDK